MSRFKDSALALRKIPGTVGPVRGGPLITVADHPDGYFGHDGTAESSVPFLLEVIDITGGAQVDLVTENGFNETWAGARRGAVYTQAKQPCLVREVKASSTITSFRAVHL